MSQTIAELEAELAAAKAAELKDESIEAPTKVVFTLGEDAVIEEDPTEDFEIANSKGEVIFVAKLRTSRSSIAKLGMYGKAAGVDNIGSDIDKALKAMALILANYEDFCVFLMSLTEPEQARLTEAIAGKYRAISTKYQQGRNTGR